MRHTKNSIILAFILAVGSTLAGCGGGSSSSPVGTTGAFSFTSPASSSVTIGESRAIDVDAVNPAGDTITYTLSGLDADKFSIDADNGVVSFKVGAVAGVYHITVTAQTQGDSISQNITITVTIPPNHAPNITSAAAVSVQENQLNAIDIDANDSDGDTITYSISGTDAASFTINPATGVVVFKTAPDFETKNSYTFTAHASDGVADTTQNITVTITDVAEGSAPVITTPSTASVDENQKSAIDVDATDSDGDTIVYSIEGGADGDAFDINSTTGVVTFKTAPDYETKNSYALTVGASDLTSTTTKEITISINDLQGGSLVLKTGQTLKYLTGDDGDYQYGQNRSFTATGLYINNWPIFIDGRVLIENKTKVHWKNDAFITTKNYQDAANYCNGLSYNGKTDWRLPSIDELISIANRGENNYFGSFNNIKTDKYYWSQTPYKRAANKHFIFSFKLGNDSVTLDTTLRYVTCVRKDFVLSPIFPFQPRFTRPGIFVSGNVITDSKTKLQWLDPTNNFGFPIILTPASGTWQEAIEGCNNLSANGKSDWRLPNINELLTIVDRSKSSGNAFYDIFDTVAADTYFSSTTRNDDSSKAWGVNFATGQDAAGISKSSVKKYRCVRSLGD